jgi:ACS family hexuronate transporter-like MFS transporter
MKIKNLRWIIVALLFIATGLSFLDRQVLSLAIIKIKDDFHMTDVQYGWINTAFLLSYAIMFTLGGWLIDRFGTRIGLAVSVGIWSLSSAMHGMVHNVWQMGMARFFLGLGEGGAFPGAAKGVAEWFPQKERGLAMGIAIGGSALGAVVAPPLTVYMTAMLGWRGTFMATGLIGGVWLLVWLIFFRKPQNSKLITEKEKALIEEGQKEEKTGTRNGVPFKEILKTREAWGLIAIRFLLDPVFYFIMFWIPKYLSEERGLSFEQIGDLFWIPFLALGISNMMGGWASDKLINRGLSANKSRKIIMGVAAAVTMLTALTTAASSVGMAIFFISLFMFAHGFWITNYITITSEIFGKFATSTVVGMAGTAGAVAGLIINPLIGKVVENYSYLPMRIESGRKYTIGFVVLLVMIPRIKEIKFKEKNIAYGK